jgi:UDP-galactopyranose mutase
MPCTIIVFSPLRWNCTQQRPHRLLSRLAQHYQILYVEEPLQHDNHIKKSFLHTFTPLPNVLVCQPYMPAGMPALHNDSSRQLRKLVRQLVNGHDEHIAWFYTPKALPQLRELKPRLVVYDCMEEATACRQGSARLAQHERAALAAADLVFVDGPGPYRFMRDYHPNVHCFPNYVSKDQFVLALDRANSHPEHRHIPGPRLGFYGVIDARFDCELIAKVADAHSMWQIVLVGPVIGIDPASLPQRPNIHYLGPQPYVTFPQFLAGWDVCLLPFALNESARNIGPTALFEYMAAELPIVSTPPSGATDVYGDVVTCASDARTFIAACEAALLASPEEHQKRIEKMRRVLASTSWDATAEQIRQLMDSTARRTVSPMIHHNQSYREDIVWQEDLPTLTVEISSQMKT